MQAHPFLISRNGMVTALKLFSTTLQPLSTLAELHLIPIVSLPPMYMAILISHRPAVALPSPYVVVLTGMFPIPTLLLLYQEIQTEVCSVILICMWAAAALQRAIPLTI